MRVFKTALFLFRDDVSLSLAIIENNDIALNEIIDNLISLRFNLLRWKCSFQNTPYKPWGYNHSLKLDLESILLDGAKEKKSAAADGSFYSFVED